MDGSVLKDRLGHQFASAEEIFQILNACKTVFYDCEIKIKTKFRIFLFIALKIPESILMNELQIIHLKTHFSLRLLTNAQTAYVRVCYTVLFDICHTRPH